MPSWSLRLRMKLSKTVKFNVAVKSFQFRHTTHVRGVKDSSALGSAIRLVMEPDLGSYGGVYCIADRQGCR